ncbi:hypothetical protein MVEN_01419100 [Mycena venus]|uniref:Uncharacterized protein n=1 Tax=Mycena venus TaxID=2733690 RepID=A0A8H6XZ05_9AGAR|nr:hypothetical protein MVEN_01419100 [Mycena venus]
MIRLTCRDFIPVYCITCLVFLITTAPALIHRFYPQAAPLAAACVWLAMTLVHGLAALYFIGALLSFGMLTIDAYKWLTLRLRRACSTPAPGPIALEDGTAAPSPTGDSDTPAPTPSSSRGMILRICLFGVLSAFLALCLILMCWIGDVISLKRPLSENLHNLAAFVFEGFPAVLVLFIVLALRVLKQRLAARRQEAAAQELSTPSADGRELGVAAAKEATDV